MKSFIPSRALHTGKERRHKLENTFLVITLATDPSLKVPCDDCNNFMGLRKALELQSGVPIHQNVKKGREISSIVYKENK